MASKESHPRLAALNIVNGHLVVKGPKPTPLVPRFWANIDIGDEPNACWLWTGPVGNHGYGVMRGSRRMRRFEVLTHRMSWWIATGKDPGVMSVLHRCDVRLCVNPSHLFLGTQRDNMQDMWRKGRGNPQRGERSSNARLTWELVERLRREFNAGEWRSKRRAARAYGVSHTTVIKALSGRTWAQA
jgi:hypothetical protein